MTESYMVRFYNKRKRITKTYGFNFELCVAKSIVRHMTKVNNSAIYWVEVEPKRYW